MHICTNESFAAGGIDLGFGKCKICLNWHKQTATYVGQYCHGCKQTHDIESGIGYVCKQQRWLLGLTRKQLGIVMGLKTATIARYEWVKPSKVYIKRLETLVYNIRKKYSV